VSSVSLVCFCHCVKCRCIARMELGGEAYQDEPQVRALITRHDQAAGAEGKDAWRLLQLPASNSTKASREVVASVILDMIKGSQPTTERGATICRAIVSNMGPFSEAWKLSKKTAREVFFVSLCLCVSVSLCLCVSVSLCICALCSRPRCPPISHHLYPLSPR
jgi:hypothetical protein